MTAVQTIENDSCSGRSRAPLRNADMQFYRELLGTQHANGRRTLRPWVEDQASSHHFTRVFGHFKFKVFGRRVAIGGGRFRNKFDLEREGHSYIQAKVLIQGEVLNQNISRSTLPTDISQNPFLLAEGSETCFAAILPNHIPEGVVSSDDVTVSLTDESVRPKGIREG